MVAASGLLGQPGPGVRVREPIVEDPWYYSDRIEVSVTGETPVEFDWYIAPIPEGYVEGDPVPAGATLYRTDSYPEPTTHIIDEEGEYINTEGELFWPEVTGNGNIWVKVTTPVREETYAFTYPILGGPPPMNTRWDSIPEALYPGSRLANGWARPNIRFQTTTPILAYIYLGETGDTSNLIGTRQIGGIPFNTRLETVDARGDHIFNEAEKIWVRVFNWGGSVDLPAITLNVLEPDELEVVDWISIHDYANPGTRIRLRVALNGPTSGYRAKWYYGSPGDTGRPVTNLNPVSERDLFMEVPEQQEDLWARVTVNDHQLDSPVTTVMPLEVTAPVVMDPPNDIYTYPDSYNGPGIDVVTMVAVGGGLTYQWYAKSPSGDLTPLSHGGVPDELANSEHLAFLTPPEGTESLHAVLQNELGSITTRDVRMLRTEDDILHVLNYPRKVTIRENDIIQQEMGVRDIEQFWMQMSCEITRMELYRKDDDTAPVLSGSGPYSFFSGAHLMWIDGAVLRTTYAQLPSGEYFLRAVRDDSHVDTGTITLVNEILDPPQLDTPATAFPLSVAGANTSGGIFRAKVFVSKLVRRSSMQLYAGPIGDRSMPLDFDTSHMDEVYSASDFKDFGDYFFNISWVPNAEEVYWLEARTHADELVRTILRFPQGSEPTDFNVLLPPGVDEIPIPHLTSLPDSPVWRMADDSTTTRDVLLPIQVKDMTRPQVEFSMWGRGQSAEETYSVSVDHKIPPVILSQETKVAAVEGRVLHTSRVLGDVTRTQILARALGGEWEIITDANVKLTGGFTIPDTAEEIKTVYYRDDISSEAVYMVNRIPTEFWQLLDVVSTYQDAVATTRMGSFLSIRDYPVIEHAELGWMWTQPVDGWLLFYGNTEPGSYSWNWIHPLVFPAIYSTGSESWKYYWLNGYGWFWDYSTQDWYSVAG